VGRRTRAKAPAARELARLHGWRLGRLLGQETSTFTYRRPLAYLSARVGTGLLGGAVEAMLVFGAVTVIGALVLWSRGLPVDGMRPTALIVTYLAGLSLVLGFLAFQGLRSVAALEGRLAARLLGPSRAEVLSGRIERLSASRAAAVAAVDDERRRIERDLHDGVQQRMVALAMLIGRARRGDRPELLARAQDEAQAALDELREVSWRVYPAALDEAGLDAALESVAERSPIPVTLACDVGAALPSPVRTAAYFVVSEAITNAAKHSGASAISVHIGRVSHGVRLRVSDNGVGGATMGPGLSGLERRVAAHDGDFALHSPAGGPTVITVELPCA
jgi:signal transduction histidine kinase